MSLRLLHLIFVRLVATVITSGGNRKPANTDRSTRGRRLEVDAPAQLPLPEPTATARARPVQQTPFPFDPRSSESLAATLTSAVDNWKHYTYLGTGVHPRHPKKEVNEVLDYADQQGFEVEQTASGHKWGRIKCTCGAFISIWSTPKSPYNHGRQLRR